MSVHMCGSHCVKAIHCIIRIISEYLLMAGIALESIFPPRECIFYGHSIYMPAARRMLILLLLSISLSVISLSNVTSTSYTDLKASVLGCLSLKALPVA